MSGRLLVSKILAAGLSAGVFLIWWPQHHATTGLASLIVRGALWTLTFELLLLAFAPLEGLVAARVRDRVSLPREIPLKSACVLACVGAGLPAALLSGAHTPRAVAHKAPPPPRRIIVVKHLRPKVVVRREIVQVAVPAAAAHPAPVTPVPVKPTVVKPAKKAPKTKPTPKATITTKKTTATPAEAPAADAQPEENLPDSSALSNSAGS